MFVTSAREGFWSAPSAQHRLWWGAVPLAVAVALIAGIQGNAGWAHGAGRGDEPLSWQAALHGVEPAESSEPLPEYLIDYPWTWQERASQAASQIRDTYPDDFSWFAFVPDRPGARIGFTGDVPDGAAQIIESLRAHGEAVEVFTDQALTEHELLAANVYLTGAARHVSPALVTVELTLGASPALAVTGATSETDAVGDALTRRLAALAETIDAPALTELPLEFEIPVTHDATDPVYDGMVVGPQPRT